MHQRVHVFQFVRGIHQTRLRSKAKESRPITARSSLSSRLVLSVLRSARKRMALDAIIHRPRYGWWSQIQQAPLPTLARTLYTQRQRLAKATIYGPESDTDITVVCVSDTHNTQPRLPPGDVLVHAGDLTETGTLKELQAQLDWLNTQLHAHRIVIAGNHDILLEDQLDGAKAAEFGRNPRLLLQWGSVIYLNCTEAQVTVRGRTLKVYGHPATQKGGNWAFQYTKGTDVFTSRVPDDVDILITHSPPKYHLDLVGWGDQYLLQELWRVRPKLHVFGHVHAGRGKDVLHYDKFERLYEGVCSGRAGVFALVHMVLLLPWMLILGTKRSRKTVLVNAAAVRGFKNQDSRTIQSVRI